MCWMRTGRPAPAARRDDAAVPRCLGTDAGLRTGRPDRRRVALPARADGLPSALSLRCRRRYCTTGVLGQFHAVCETRQAALLQTLQDDLAAASTLAPLPAWQPPSDREDAPQRFTDGVGKGSITARAGTCSSEPVAPLERAVAEAPRRRRCMRSCVWPTPRRSPGCSWRRAGRGQLLARALCLRCNGDDVQTRRSPHPPALRWRTMRAHPGAGRPSKERSEHVMLIDLERNDLGRICAPAV